MPREEKCCANCGGKIRWEFDLCFACRRATGRTDGRYRQSAIDFDEIDRLLAIGDAYLRIAVAVGCSFTTVAKRAKDTGVRRKPGRKPVGQGWTADVA